MRPEDRIRLQHMQEAIEQAMEFVRGRRCEELHRDAQLRLALIKCIEIVGEAAAKVTGETQSQYPDLPWREMAAMRNRLVHVYFDVNVNIIWSTAQEDFPALKVQIQRLLSDAGCAGE